jgi:hypothetical protein
LTAPAILVSTSRYIEPMETAEIIELAANTLSTVAQNVATAHYSDEGARLRWAWSTRPEDGLAIAFSYAEPPSPPDHLIRISHELVLDLYHDAESYCSFAQEELTPDRLNQFYPDFDPKPAYPEGMSPLAAIQNMFMASLTWVFFHELGHCMQEHCLIRRKYCHSQQPDFVSESECVTSSCSQTDASILHATEYAADAEATQHCIEDLVYHFLMTHIVDGNGDLLNPAEIDPENVGFIEFRQNLYLFICGVTLVFCRFNGQRAIFYSRHPERTHPLPLRRLERLLPQVWEVLDLGSLASVFHGLTRKQLVSIGIGAATSACMYWLQGAGQWPKPGEVFIPSGLPQDPYKETYWPPIIAAWDRISNDIIGQRRYGSELGLLKFSNAFRDLVRCGT